tara:strand:- start:5755 stop:6486 length:732 start_codon:yes stop_codon:yes gene_type:complete
MYYDLIYVNGDSFVAGNGLAQGEYTDDNLYTLKEWKHNYNKVFNDSTLKKIHSLHLSGYLTNKEKENAWPSTLEKITNIKTINEAYYSQSALTIAIKSIQSLSKIKDKNKKILALIGTAPFGRLWFPKAGTNTIQLSVFGGQPTELENNIAEYYVNNASLDDLKSQYEISFLGLKKFAEKNNIDLYFINHYLSEQNNLVNEYVIDTIGKDADHTLSVFTACGHYPKKYHDSLAHRLKQRFEEI